MEYRPSSNGRSFTGKSMYDGVFAAVPSNHGVSNISPRVDYNEIFGGGCCSIPILDVPELRERRVLVDVRSSKVDYSKIFGDFGEMDFASSCEESFDEMKKKSDVSVKEVRSHSRGSDSSNHSVEKHISSDETSNESLNGVKQFNMYHKMNQGSKNETNGTARVAQFHNVSGSTCSIDEVTPVRVTQPDKPLASVKKAAKHNSFGDTVTESKHCRKPLPGFPTSGTNTQTSESGVDFSNKLKQNRSYSIDMSFDAYDFVFKEHPSKVPAVSGLTRDLGNGKGERDIFDDAAGLSSPSYFDEEVNENSVAAASAAAVKKAIERAQARLKIAKESMEKRKEGLQRSEKLSFKESLTAEKRRERKIENKADRCKEESQKICAEVNTPKQVFAGMGKQNMLKPGHVSPPFRDRENSFTPKETVGGETPEQESKSTLPDNVWEETVEMEEAKQEFKSTEVDHKREEMSEQEAIKQFFAHAKISKCKVTLEFEQADGEKKAMQPVDQCVSNDTIMAEKNCEKLVENGDELKEIDEEEFGRDINAVRGAQESEELANRSKPAQEVHDQEEKDYKSEFSQEPEKTEDKASNEKGAFRQNDCQESIGIEKVEAQDMEGITNVKRTKEALRSIGNEKKQEDPHQREENEIVFNREENDGNVTKMCRKEENGDRHEESFETVEYAKISEGVCKHEENQKEQNVDGVENSEKLDKVHEHKIVETLDDLHNIAEIEEKLVKDHDLEGHEKLKETKVNEKTILGAYQMKENEKRQKETCEWVETEGTQKEVEQGADNKIYMQETQEAMKNREDVCEAAVDECQPFANENLTGIWEACNKKETINNDVKVAPEVITNETNVTNREPRGYENLSKEMKVEYELEEKGIYEISSKAHGELSESSKQINNILDALALNKTRVTLGETDTEIRDEQNNQHAEGWKTPYNLGKIDGPAHEFGSDDNDVKNAEIAFNQEEEENSSESSHDERWVDGENVEETQLPNIVYGEAKTTEIAEEMKTSESKDRIEENKCGTVKEEEREIEDTVTKKVELEKEDFRKQDEEENVEGTQSPSVLYGDAENNEIALEMKRTQSTDRNEENNCETTKEEERETKDAVPKEAELEKEDFRKQDEEENVEETQSPSILYGDAENNEIALEMKRTQSTDRTEENNCETTKEEEREIKDTVSKEVQLEKEHSRKQYEEKEREREREREKEKERVAVERAIREARERAYAEARERAAEARQRAKVESSGRSGKASAVANDKSSAEKASMEAKLKAERAAVERATTEARERALEKAISGKTAFDARKQAAKFGADTFSGPSRDSGTRPIFPSFDPQNKSSGPSSSSSYPNSSSRDAPTETLAGANSESSQRHRARWERHQRTAERAAKALGEKNERDLLAQKEQAERNRLAEALDADVKRWSSGKEGNLRALLSTLQYILGPDSGWQAVPLTDIVTNTAVKKAYRKATLCVHPDKLQQRGANIQQKYICEKVFDLLKDGWNKFSAQER